MKRIVGRIENMESEDASTEMTAAWFDRLFTACEQARFDKFEPEEPGPQPEPMPSGYVMKPMYPYVRLE